MTNLRKPGILADLNFELPYAERSYANKTEVDVTAIVRLAGPQRKTSRHSLDISGLLRRMLEQDPDWKPKCAAIGNDKLGNMFLVFDEKDISNLEISYSTQGRMAYVHSKALVKKVLLCMKKEVDPPTLKGTGIQILFKAVPVNKSDRIFSLEPFKYVQEFGDGKTPDKIYNL